MIYQLSLFTVGLVVGCLMIFSHFFGLLRKDLCMEWTKKLPRSRSCATILFALAAIWTFLLVRSIDLGEFSPLRNMMLVAIVVGTILTWIYVPEFLAVRALGMLLLLAADPLLEACMLRNELTRFFLVILAYVWIVIGLFFVGLPYLLRDIIQWITASSIRWRGAMLAGVIWGSALVVCALFWWQK